MLPELRVEVRKLSNTFFAVTKRENGQEICTHEFQHDPTGLTHLGPLWLLERGTLGPGEMQRLGIGLSNKASEGQVALYGRRLYEYLFGKGRKLRDFLKANPSYQQARLALSLNPETESLWRLPWEYLHDGETFLCLEGHMLLSRRPQDLEELAVQPMPLPLRMLLIIAAPDDREALDVERELAVMQDALDDIIQTGALRMDVLSEPTLPALRRALRREHYHLLHYVGHGEYSHKQQRGFLCFETAAGQTDRLGSLHLKPLMAQSPAPRLMTIAAGQSAQIGVLAAFDHVATGLLQAGMPAVLSIPTSLRDESTIALARALYWGLAQGEPVITCLREIRQALKAIDDERPDDQRRFDWGVPALYARARPEPLAHIDSTPIPPAPPPVWIGDNVAGLPVPHNFVDRSAPLHALRQTVDAGGRCAYVWGSEGVGKTALVAQLVAGAELPPEDVLVIHCHELLEPVLALDKIAMFWRGKGTEVAAQAAALLLDARRDPAERAHEAQQVLGDARHVIIFDDLHTWFAPGDVQETMTNFAEIADPTTSAALSGLISAQAATTYIFTGRQRWLGIGEVAPERREVVHLSALSQRYAAVLMNALPHLREEPLEIKLALYRCVGGLPLTLRLFDAWLAGAANRSIPAFLDDPPLQAASPEMWARFFIDELLGRLDPGEHEALTALTVLKKPFGADFVPKITRIAARYADDLLASWRDMALLQRHRQDAEGKVWYAFHPLVRACILEQLGPDIRGILHTRAAAYYGAPFMDEARRRVVQQISAWPEERIEWLARDGNGVLGMWVRQTQNLKRARQSMDHALAWQYHLFRAQQPRAATQIVRAVVPVLNRWGQRDLSQALLRHSVEATEGDERADSLNQLAEQHIEIGHLKAALDVYEEVYQAFEAQGARAQMAHILHRIGSVHYRVGQLDLALQKYEAALPLMRAVNDRTGQALCLHQLTRIHRRKGQYKQALVHSQAACELEAQRNDRAGLARALHAQGVILKLMERRESAMERLRQSLEIARDTGDERYVVANLQEIADLHQQQGQLDEAIARLLEALELCQRSDRHRAIAIFNALSALYTRQGQATEAAQMRELARRLAASGQ